MAIFYGTGNTRIRNVMSLDVLKPIMQRDGSLPAKMSWDSWRSHEEIRAEKVALYRRYADGDHDIALSQEMRAALRIEGEDVFSLNHCENIVETLADRIKLAGVKVSIDGDDGNPNPDATKAAQDWVERLLQQNRVDSLQIGLHTDTVRDGIDFVMVAYDPDAKRVVWHHEPAFDGYSGMIAVYGDDGQTPTMAVKIWHEMQVDGRSTLVDRVRLNCYYPDRVEKYVANAGRLQQYKDNEGDEWPYRWTDAGGKGLGVAVVPFVYKRRAYTQHGMSRLDDVIPIQRAANRTLVSLVATAENIGFPIRYLFGGEVPATIQPGTWIQIAPPKTKPLPGGGTAPLSTDERAKLLEQIGNVKIGQLQSADLVGLLDQLDKFITQMYVISGTPYPEGAGANISGEALKQLDIRLVGTAERTQVSLGNAYEDLVELSARVEAAYGAGAPWEPGRVSLQAEWLAEEPNP